MAKATGTVLVRETIMAADSGFGKPGIDVLHERVIEVDAENLPEGLEIIKNPDAAAYPWRPVEDK
jgi:hypothetical protein